MLRLILSTLAFISTSAWAGTLATGILEEVSPGHPTQGTIRLVETNQRRFLLIDDSFKTVRGPDVKAILATGSKGEGEYVELGPLKEYTGAQVFEVPADIDLGSFESFAIWCKKFNVTFAAADFERPKP